MPYKGLDYAMNMKPLEGEIPLKASFPSLNAGRKDLTIGFLTEALSIPSRAGLESFMALYNYLDSYVDNLSFLSKS